LNHTSTISPIMLKLEDEILERGAFKKLGF
jgi:hypothetical protein